MKDKEAIQPLIVIIRGKKVMLSPHQAELYGVEPRSLTQAVRRNSERFPGDFMFQLMVEELESLRSQNVILEKKAVVLFQSTYRTRLHRRGVPRFRVYYGACEPLK